MKRIIASEKIWPVAHRARASQTLMQLKIFDLQTVPDMSLQTRQTELIVQPKSLILLCRCAVEIMQKTADSRVWNIGARITQN